MNPAPQLPPLPPVTLQGPPEAWHPDWPAPGPALRLYTFQPAAVAKRLASGETHRAEPALSHQSGDYDGYEVPYHWISRQLARHTPRPEGARLPVWAWYVNDPQRGPRAPDLRRTRSYPQDTVMLTFEAPASEVLLSDFMLWHQALNLGSCGSEAEEEALKDWLSHHQISRYETLTGTGGSPQARAYRRWVQRSWQRVLSPEWSAPGWSREPGERCAVQACVWEIQPEQVLAVRALKVRP